MNFPENVPNATGPDPDVSRAATLAEMDATLRMIANLPAPAGLEDRMFAGVLKAPRKAGVLSWPRRLYARDWVRSIAAAAIVLAVGGGGWGIYAHVAPNEPVRAIAAPRRIFEPGGFSSAEVIRRPQTLNGPVVKTEPAAAAKTKPSEHWTLKKRARQTAGPRGRTAKLRPVATSSQSVK